MSIQRLVEMLVGVALLGYCVYAIHVGQILGMGRRHVRWEEPWAYWVIVLLGLAVGAAFLLGAVSWRA